MVDPPTSTPNATNDSDSDSTSAAAIVIGVTIGIGVLTILLIACIMCACIASCPLYAIMHSNRKQQTTATATPTVYQPSPPQLSQTTYPRQEMAAYPPAIQGYPAQQYQATAATPYAGYSGQPVKQEFESPYQRYPNPQAYPVPQLPPPNVATSGVARVCLYGRHRCINVSAEGANVRREALRANFFCNNMWYRTQTTDTLWVRDERKA